MRRSRVLLALAVSACLVGSAAAQSPVPPDRWHPYRGGINCIQVADVQSNFNCAPGTTVDPKTGNVVIGGTITFTGFSSSSATYFPGVVIGTIGSGAQTQGSADLVIASSPYTILASGPLIKGVTFRVRPSPIIPGYCRVVVSGGNGIGEYAITVLPPTGVPGVPNALLNQNGSFQVTDFPGGPLGC